MIIAVLTTLFLIIDLVKELGIFFPKKPVIRVEVIPGHNFDTFGLLGQCVKFSFSSLPAKFAFEEIHLDITALTDPRRDTVYLNSAANRGSDSEDIASSIGKGIIALTTLVKASYSVVSGPYLTGHESKIVVHCPIQTEEDDDAFIILWCPILTDRRENAMFTVVPTRFYDLEGPIRRLDVKKKNGDAIDDGVVVTLVGTAIPPDLDPTISNRANCK